MHTSVTDVSVLLIWPVPPFMVQSGSGLRFTHPVNIRHRLLLKDANTEDGYYPYLRIFGLSVSRLGLQSAESLGKHYGVIKRILL